MADDSKAELDAHAKEPSDLRTTEGADAFVKNTFEVLSAHLSRTGSFPAPYALVLVTLDPDAGGSATLPNGGIVRVESPSGGWNPNAVRATARRIATLYEAVGAAMVFPMTLTTEADAKEPVGSDAATSDLKSIAMQFEHLHGGERLFVAEVKEKDGEYSLGEAKEPYPGWTIDAGGRILFPDKTRTLH